MQHNEIVATNIKTGDLYYVKVNNTFYFMQVIHSEQTHDAHHKYGYFVVVFDKTYAQLPTTIQELDLQKIYVPKYVWKKTTLYAGIWCNEPHLKFNKELMYYDLKDKYTLTYFGNTEVCSSFSPSIVQEFSWQSECILNTEGIQVSYQHLALQVILWGLEQEEKGKTKKVSSVKPNYFKSWLAHVEPQNIVKTEKIISKFADVTEPTLFLKELKKCILLINKLEDKSRFITTVEAENIVHKLTEIALSKGMDAELTEHQIEMNREW